MDREASDFSPLFQPLSVGRGMKKLILKNRMVMAPMVTCLADSFGEVTQRLVDYHVKRAKGGVGTIIVEAMDIDERIFPNRLGIFHDRFINELEYLASSIRENGAAAVAQINHAGSRGNLPGPDEMNREQIGEVMDAFGRAAERVQRAGFDGVMLHGAHGYLISSFLSPLTNHRKDEYGGTREERTRFAVEVIRAVRKAVGEDFPVFFRMNGSDFLPGGITPEDAGVSATFAEAAGADVIAIGGGVGIVARDLALKDNKSYFQIIPPMYFPRGYRADLGAQIKKRLTVPLSISGRINDPHLAREIIAAGKAELIDLGRQLIADPDFPRKIAEGRIDDIRRCIACNYCFGMRMRQSKHLHCAVNPWAGREAELKEFKPAGIPRSVMVVGGGVAGMEASRWLRRRGHRVSLHEKSHRLGGQILLAGLPPHKGEIGSLAEFLERQMGKLGVEVHLDREVTPALVLGERPDVVVVAVGGRQIPPGNIAISPKMPRMNAWEVLGGKAKYPGKKVVILGGGFVGAEIAEFLLDRKMAEDVTIVEMREAVALDMELASRQMLIERLLGLGVEIIPNFKVAEVTSSEVVGQDGKDGQPRKIPADLVVISLGTEPVEFPVEDLKKRGIEVLIIGDAREPQGIAEAVREGYLAGISV